MSAHLTLIAVLNEEKIIDKLKAKRSFAESQASDVLQIRAEIIGLNREIREREEGLLAFLNDTDNLGESDEGDDTEDWETGEITTRRN